MLCKNLLICLMLGCFTFSFGQSESLEKILFTSIEVIEEHSVASSTVPWNSFKRQVKKKWRRQPSEKTMISVLLELFEFLDDNHGGFYFKDSTYRLNKNVPEISKSILDQWKSGAGVKTHLLEGNVGYLRIPGMPYLNKADCDRRAQQLNDSLCSLLKKSPRGLIIDLRLNGGGAMYPMILGLQSLLEEGKVGSYSSGEKESWLLEGNRFLMDSIVYAELSSACPQKYIDLPIAFLISPVTGSSAEFLLITFQGRPNTVLVGTKTAGFVTATQGFPIQEDVFLLLSTAYGVDRNGIVYKDAFMPHIPCSSSDEFIDLPSDDKVNKAIEWIKKTRE